MLSEEGFAVSRRNTPLSPFLEYHVSGLGQLPLVLILPRLLARCVTGGLIFSCTRFDQRLGDLTKRGQLCNGGGMIGLSRRGERCSLFSRQRLNYSARTCHTSLDMCPEIDCTPLDVEARPF